MSEDNRDIIVGSRSTSCSNQVGSYAQLSAQDAALLSAIPPELQSCEHLELTVFLLAMLQGFSQEVMSNDVRWFASHRAKLLCTQAGIAEERFDELMAVLAPAMEKLRRSNPASTMF